jgi:hypothetical protein
LLFLYNSFGAPVMLELIANLERRMAEGGGVVDVIYQNAELEDLFVAHSEFRKMWTARLALSEEDAAADLVSTPEDVTSAYRVGG